MSNREKSSRPLPRIIRYALKNNPDLMQQYLRAMGPGVLQQTDPITNGTAYHLAAYCGHLEVLKCLIRFGCRQDLLKVNNEGCTVLDTALDSQRPSAQVLIYLLFEAKVPFGADTLELLKEKKSIFIQKIKEVFFPEKSSLYQEQLEHLLSCAGQPEWEKRRHSNFLSKVPSLITLSSQVVKREPELVKQYMRLPEEAREKVTETPMSLRSLAAYRFKYANQQNPHYEPRTAIMKPKTGENIILKMSAKQMEETCSDSINEITKTLWS